jgi:hypothetical protein
MKLLNVKSVKGLEAKVEAIVGNEATSKSSKMKDMFKLGVEVGAIAKKLGVRYNFVYNVVSNMVIVEGLEVEQGRDTSKRDTVMGMFDKGMSVKEVAVDLKSNQQYLYKLHKEWSAKAVAEVVAEESKDGVK